MKKDGRQRGPKGPGICAASAQVRKRLWSYASQPRARTLQRGGTLVERFDIEPFSGFSAKWANSIGLVLFCIDAKFCNKIFVGKLLTRSTRFTCFCTAQTSIFQQNFVKLLRILRQFFANFDHFHWIFLRFWWIFLGISPNVCRKCWTFLKFLDFWWILAKSSLFWENFDRTLIWKVRMVRSLADRTFQLASATAAIASRAPPPRRCCTSPPARRGCRVPRRR